MCGANCEPEAVTKEERLAFLEFAEKRIEGKLAYVRKLKELLAKEKSEKTVKAGKEQ